MMQRYSTRRQQLSETFLNEKLKNAKTYDRIAGYFSSSLLAIAGESLDAIDRIRIICNANLEAADADVAKANLLQQNAFRAEGLEQYSRYGREHFQKWYDLYSPPLDLPYNSLLLSLWKESINSNTPFSALLKPFPTSSLFRKIRLYN